MAERVEMGVQDARDGFRGVIDDALINRKETVITRHGLPVAAVIPYSALEELDRLRAAHGDASNSSE
jgi:prevent-host-death family protein